MKKSDFFKSHLGSVIFFTLLTIFTYWGTFQVPFLYDDIHAIVQNPKIQDFSQIGKLLNIENLFNRPILNISFAINRDLNGLNVWGYHIVNLGIHIGVGILLYFFAGKCLQLIPHERRSSYRFLPLTATLIHLIHPLNVQAVVYLSSRSVLLVTLFYLSSTLSFIKFFEQWDRSTFDSKCIFWLLLGLFLFFLGCGTKAIIVTLPVMGLIFYYLNCDIENRKMDSTLIIMILAPLFFYLIYRGHTFGNIFVLTTEHESMQMSRMLYLLTQIKAFIFYYLLKWFYPINLNFEPDFRLINGPEDPQFIVAALILLVGIIIFLKSKSQILKFFFLWALITLAPTSSLVPLKQIVTEHRFYLPGIGVCLGIGIVLVSAMNYSKKLLYLIGIALLFLIILNQVRSSDFKDSVSIWADTAKKSPQKALVHNNLAAAYLEKKMFSEAEQALKTTLVLNPNSDHARINLGVLLIQKKKYQEAVDEFFQAIKLGTRDPNAYYNAGLALLELDRAEESLPYLREAVKLKPQSAQYHFDYGKALQKNKLFDDALKEYRTSLNIQPNNFKAHNNRGTIFWNLKSYYFAEAAFQQAYLLNKHSITTLNNLASANLVLKDYDAAIRYLKETLAIDPENDNARQMLIAAKRMKENYKNEPPPKSKGFH